MKELETLDFASKMGQRNYWFMTLYYVVISIVLSAIYGALLAAYIASTGGLLGSLTASVDPAYQAPLMASVYAGLATLVVLLYVILFVHTLTTVVRRARDAGHTGWFTAMALVVPFGWFILGFLGSKK